MKVIPEKSRCGVVDAIQPAISDPSRLGDARTLLERKGMTKAIDIFSKKESISFRFLIGVIFR
jgi:hypothetical protein